MNQTIDEARKLLQLADVFFCTPDELEEYENPQSVQMLDMGDTWAWGTAGGEYVPDEELPEVARLFFDYGWCGILFWASERNEQMKSEFRDINRFVEFVRHEEALIKLEPDCNKRAYEKWEYVLGKGDDEHADD